MLIDTHCHINFMVKKEFNTALTPDQFLMAEKIIAEAHAHDVTGIINVGTSIIESKNCIALARRFANTWATIAVHPSDATAEWKRDVQELGTLLAQDSDKHIVAIGECGLDFHYPDYNKQHQTDLFKAQIELALEHNTALVIHIRDAYDETLKILEEYKRSISRCVIHCFSGDHAFATHCLDLGFVLGIGGPLTYPKNDALRAIFTTIPLESILLETDAPFLPPQIIRGKQNHPRYIKTIATHLAEIRNIDLETVAAQTTANAEKMFNITLKVQHR